MHTVRNRQADKSRAEAARSRRNTGKHDDGHGPVKVAAARFPADWVVPPHRGAVITSGFLLQGEAVPAAIGRKALRNAERRAAAQARAAMAAPTAEQLIIMAAIPELSAPLAEAVRPEPVTIAEPIPAGRALVPHRRGFVDVIAFALRDSGRRLARWSSARRRADDMKEKLVRAEARMRAMEAQLAALQELQDRVRKAG
ncbi:hypothetical protein [Novosphingobium sp.]|uniref:hypothetical protein n=1 Tax=Novosphingobium sp. TaxID=1874826 RepID=UPI003D128571